MPSGSRAKGAQTKNLIIKQLEGFVWQLNNGTISSENYPPKNGDKLC